MNENQELYALLGNSIQAPEQDYDDDIDQSKEGLPVEEEALMLYYFISITNHIGKPDFKENFNSVIGDVLTYSTTKQQMLAKEILNKISEIYHYEPSTIVDYNTEEDIHEIYQLLKFLEYDNEEFILSIWKYLDINISTCKNNADKIIYEIEENLKSKYYSKLVFDFLRTNDKENLIQWFCVNTHKLTTNILIQKGTK